MNPIGRSAIDIHLSDPFFLALSIVDGNYGFCFFCFFICLLYVWCFFTSQFKSEINKEFKKNFGFEKQKKLIMMILYKSRDWDEMKDDRTEGVYTKYLTICTLKILYTCAYNWGQFDQDRNGKRNNFLNAIFF